MALEQMIVALRDAGFPLVLLWLLTLSVVYGLLSHAGIPKSITVRGVIAIVSAFLVLLAAAATPAVAFIQNLVMAGVMIALALIIAIILLEIAGIKVSGEGVFAKHPRLVAIAVLILIALIFIGAGGLGLLNIPAIRISDTMIAVLFFIIVMAVAMYVIVIGTGGSSK